jgi:hypothetical protein
MIKSVNGESGFFEVVTGEVIVYTSADREAVLRWAVREKTRELTKDSEAVGFRDRSVCLGGKATAGAVEFRGVVGRYLRALGLLQKPFGEESLLELIEKHEMNGSA